MSRILLVTPDGAKRRELAHAFEPLGHTLSACDEVAQAQGQAIDIIVVDTGPACSQGREAVKLFAQGGGGGPRIVWTGPGVSSGLGLVFAEVPDAVLPSPVTMASAGAALARLDRLVGPSASAGSDLEAVDGPLERFPPFRVLWQAHRTRASGRLEVFDDDIERELFLADGRVVGGRGFPDALVEHGVQGSEVDDLGGLIGRAIGGGARPDLVLEAAAMAVGRGIADTVGRSGGMVFFDSRAEAPPHAVPLPVTIPILLARGLRACRPITRVRKMLGPLRADAFEAIHDGLGPGGLPPVALRLWRATDACPQLGELVGQDDEAWLAADLLLQLGLGRLVVFEPPAQAAPQLEAEEAPRRKERERPKRSEVLEELLSERKRLRSLDAPGILGIAKSEDLEQRSLDSRYRLLSARFHPDRYARDADNVKRVSRDCFAMVSDAYAVLKDDALRDEVRLRLEAREQGRTYSSDSDKRRALLLYTQGDVAFRKRRYDEALPLLEHAYELHPEPWKTVFLLVRTRFETGKQGADECAMELMKIEAPEGRAKAEVLYQLGEMLMVADREKAAFKAFEDAVAQYPDHVDAKRRLRLRRMRRDGVDAVRDSDAKERSRRAEERAADSPERGGRRDQPDTGGSTVSGILGGLFKRKES